MTGSCWLWDGPLNADGYGRFSFRGKRVLAHRRSYELFIGPIPTDTLDHLCRNPECVNPDHLEAVTRGENVRRGLAGKYQQKQVCSKGHEFDRVYKTVRGTKTRACSICSKERSRQFHLRKRGETN